MLRMLSLSAFVCCLTASSLMAQGLRVSTVVYDAGRLDSTGNEPVLSSSFSLFHNGRVYDYVEAAAEVVIFEPTSRRFTVLNRDQAVYTNVAFDEVRHLLQARGPKVDAYLLQLRKQKSPDADRAARTLSFQLNPQFENQFDRRSGRLSLKSSSWNYTVSTREWNDADQLKRYIDYTDWAAQLNYVLHPGTSFPEPRLALNRQLRELENRIPVVVLLDRRPDDRLILRAEHQFVRNLTDRDRQLINSWETDLKSSNFRNVPFLQYQKATLVAQQN